MKKLKMFITNQKFLLTVIVIVAFVLRVWQLGAVPPSPDWDEVALGYNAYSVMQTGRDEYGKWFPIILRSFDDYKPALYMYLTMPFIALFGLTTFAVRMPSTVFGTLAVLATYFLVKELFPKSSGHQVESHRVGKNKLEDLKTLRLDSLPLLAAALLAISPWSVHFSRIGFEANVGDALNIFAALFFLKGLKKPWMLSLSTLFAALSLHVYQSEKVFTPLFMLVMVIIFFRELRKVAFKKIIVAILVGVAVTVPLIVMIITTPEVLLRAKGTSITQNQTTLLKDEILLKAYDEEQGDLLGTILNNRRIVYAKEIINGYLSHYNLNWYFITGDLQRHHAPNMGMLYLWELPFLFVGIYILLFSPFPKKTKIFLFAWFLLAPVPASVTVGVPHAVRTLNFLPTFQIFIAIGIVTALAFIQKNQELRIKNYGVRLLYGIFCAVVIFNFLYYLNQNFVQQNYFNGFEWQYGYQEAVKYVEDVQQDYKKIIVSDVEPMDKSYMFFLFYLKYPPEKYQIVGQHSSGGFAEHHAFDKYEFRPIKWDSEEKNPDILYLGRPKDFPKGIYPLKVIYYQNGEPAMMFVKG